MTSTGRMDRIEDALNSTGEVGVCNCPTDPDSNVRLVVDYGDGIYEVAGERLTEPPPLRTCPDCGRQERVIEIRWVDG